MRISDKIKGYIRNPGFTTLLCLAAIIAALVITTAGRIVDAVKYPATAETIYEHNQTVDVIVAEMREALIENDRRRPEIEALSDDAVIVGYIAYLERRIDYLEQGVSVLIMETDPLGLFKGEGGAERQREVFEESQRRAEEGITIFGE